MRTPPRSQLCIGIFFRKHLFFTMTSSSIVFFSLLPELLQHLIIIRVFDKITARLLCRLDYCFFLFCCLCDVIPGTKSPHLVKWHVLPWLKCICYFERKSVPQWHHLEKCSLCLNCNLNWHFRCLSFSPWHVGVSNVLMHTLIHAMFNEIQMLSEAWPI